MRSLLGNARRLPTLDEIADIPKDLADGLLTVDRTKARLFAFVTEPMRDQMSLDDFEVIEKTALGLGVQRIYGLPVVMRYESVAIVNQLRWGLLIACIASVFIIATAFRRLSFLPLLLIPNVLPLLVAGASVHILNGGALTPAAVLALTIAFGIAVDDTIHFVLRFKQHRDSGSSMDQAPSGALHQSGRPIVVTTLLLCAGMLVTVTSVFEPVRLFGQLLMITFVTALIADLLLLPALLKQNWFKL